MSRSRLLPVLGVVLFLLLGAAAGAWWYLFGPNGVDAAELVPGDTAFFATIPNAATIAANYQTSKIKTLVDSPNVKPLIDSITNLIGQKTLDVLTSFAPNLSGQSFIALTHFDSDKPAETGFIAAMKPKAGLGNFNAFVEKLKATWPEFTKDTTSGTANIGGVDYQWLKGPGAPDKVCVAQVDGWIVTTWGEAPLLDWILRHQKKATTPSLAQNDDYKKSLAQVGKDPMTLVYLNYHVFIDILQKQLSKTNPAQSDYFAKRLGGIGGLAIGTRFENGEIVDRISIQMPRQVQLDNGLSATPCAFDTLKFTGPDTRLYTASAFNWQVYWKNIEEQFAATSATNPLGTGALNGLKQWAKDSGLDFQHNVIDPLGSEWSIQLDWAADAAYPELGIFVKLDKPEDFKPTIQAIIEGVRKNYSTAGVIKELDSNGQKFAALKFVQPLPLSPTITEDGPYLGIFLTESQAVRAFAQDPSIGLTHNPDFARQIGDKRNGASQLIFLDTPQLLNRTYTTTLPYISMASMFNKQLADLLKGKTLPPDVNWLAPLGTWSCVSIPNGDSVQSYSVSGMGNQAILIGGVIAGGAIAAETMGFLPKPQAPPTINTFPTGGPAPTDTPTVSAPDATTPPAPAPSEPTPMTPPATDATQPAPDASTNAAPVTDPTPSASSTNTPPAPDAAKPQ